MNIIIVPGGARKGNASCLGTRQVWAIALTLLTLPVLLGYLTFKAQVLLAREGGELGAIAAQERALAAQRARLEDMRRHSEAHLNALALKLGQMQAQVLRLNALGARLTRMAGLDTREFNFAQEPAMGGPEKRASAPTPAPDVLGALDRLGADIDRQRERLMALESLLLDRKVSAAVTPSGWPVEAGWVSSGFGLRTDPFTGRSSHHEGVDIASRQGSQILAMGDGIVSYAGEKVGYGLMVELTHESGLVTRYAHTHSTLVKEGDRVAKGQAIALVGSSGRSTGPHLHFEVVRNGGAVNPLTYLVSPSERQVRVLVANAFGTRAAPVAATR
jgi:murein DD-endopeptidase MepM/ murein hydrolase activator NlpD